MNAEPPHTDGNARFVSLAALKTANNDLIKRRGTEDNPQIFLDSVAAFIQKGIATGAILNIEGERWTSQSILDYWANFLDRHDKLSAPDDIILASFDPKLAIDIPESKCPYVGLEAFREAKQDLFFGRQKLIEELLNKVTNTRCLAVVGSSGSGKSSLILAGVIPALKAGALERSKLWQYLPPIVPGLDPLASLASVIPPPEGSVEEGWIAEQIRSLKQNHFHLLDLINRNHFETSVLVVDQLEEIFTLTSDESVQKAFIGNLLALVEYADLRHTVILTMRSEFESYIAKIPEFEKYFKQGIRITPLTAVEVRDAIQKPAELVGLKFEEGIIAELVTETIGEPAGLPLLQFTLLKLWKTRQHDLVTWEAFHRLGSCREALTRAADEFYNKLTPIDQSRVKWILLRLVRPGPGGGLEVFNNRVPRANLYKSSDDREHIDRVLDGLIDAGLIRKTEGNVPGEPKIEVAHEALVRHWRRLVGWLDEERVNIGRRLSLTEASTRWDLSGRDSLNLLRGAQLDEALRFEDLNVLEEEFVNRSLSRKLWSKRLSYATLGAGVIALSIVAVIYGIRASKAAVKERKAFSRELAAKSLLARDRLDLALLLAVEAYRTDPTPEARNSLFTLLFGDPASKQITYLRPPAKPARALSFSRESLLTSINSDGTIDTWDTNSPQTKPEKIRVESSSATAYALSAKANVAAISTYDGEVILLDSITGQRKQVISIKDDDFESGDFVEDLCLSDDGKVLAGTTFYTDSNVQLWDTQSGKVLATVANDWAGSSSRLALTRDGSLLAYAYQEFESPRINVWDVQQKKLRRAIKIETDDGWFQNPIDALAISPDGKYVAWADNNKVSVRQTAVTSFTKDFSPNANQNITDLFFTADGKKLVSTSEDGKIIINEIETSNNLGSDSSKVQAPPGVILATALSEDGKTLVCSTQTGAVILWDLDKDSRLATQFETFNSSLSSVATTSDGLTVAAGTEEGSILFWDALTRKPTGREFEIPDTQTKTEEEAKAEEGEDPLTAKQPSQYTVTNLVFSSDNKILAAEYRNGRGILWDMVTGTPKALPIGDDEAIFELSLSPDGKSVAWIGSTKTSAGSRRQNIGTSDRTKERHLVLWGFTTNDPPQTLVPKGTESLAGLAFSYDGKTLATSDRSGSLILWNPNDGSRIAVLQNPQSQPQRLQNAVTGVALAFSLDSKTVTVASPGSSVMFWDVESRKPLDEPLTEHRRRVTKMTFSSTTQGQMMASIAFRDKIVLWDINTRQALGGISPPFVTVDESLSRDGKFLIVAGKDTLVSWDVGVDAWLRVACQIANRDLTWSEWVKYIGGEVTTHKTCTN